MAIDYCARADQWHAENGVTRPDLSDPLVLEMADRNHRPAETWTLGGDFVGVTCETCLRPYPCPTREAIDIA
jgi:hypothetical protein